eukprot:TRINITY_DN46779_c0_g1_i1.p1 TRINITY_DN46779_c0_g1~~TRINITY_DN46779_c0_g1_i1.p1  ORF type:complete len:177 (-),score=24.39 TRINITY_DN46779_c0_g1_i1:37-567(-)
MATPRRTPRTLEAQLRADSLRQPAVPPRDVDLDTVAQGATMKAIHNLRLNKHREWAPSSESVTCEKNVRGTQAKETESSRWMNEQRTKHARRFFSPRDNFVEPATMAQVVGWHADQRLRQNPVSAFSLASIGPGPQEDDPKLVTTERLYQPRSKCHMTQHMENMYQTHAQNIIRHW